MSPSPLSLVSLLFLLLNGRVQSNTCSTEGFMELSLLETKTGTNNNGQTTGLAESVQTRWIITEGNKRFSGCSSTLTEVLVGVDIRIVTGNRTQYPRIEIWRETGAFYRDPVSVDLRLSPHNFTTNGLYHYTLPTPLTIERTDREYRLGVYQPPDDRSVVRFHKVTETGQIGRVVGDINGDNRIAKDPDNCEIALQTSSILIYPITSMSLMKCIHYFNVFIGSNCNYPPIDSSFNTSSLSVTNIIPVNDTRAFPDIQFTCNGIITNWIIGITQNQTTSKHYPNIYLKRSSELIHALTVDASAATSSNGNVYNFTSDIEVQYGDILVINVTTNSNPMYYQQYNGPLNYQLDSSNGLIPLEYNDYPLISVVVGKTITVHYIYSICLLFLIEPSPSLLGISSTTTDTIHTQSTNSHTPDTATTTTNMNIPFTVSLYFVSSSSLSSSPTSTSMNTIPHITNTPSQSSHELSLTLSVTTSTPFISDGTASPPPTVSPSSTSVNDSLISNPSTTVSTEATVQSSTVSNTLVGTISTVFILLVVTILVILIVSVLVCRRNQLNKNSTDNTDTDTEKQQEGIIFIKITHDTVIAISYCRNRNG